MRCKLRLDQPPELRPARCRDSPDPNHYAWCGLSWRRSVGERRKCTCHRRPFCRCGTIRVLFQMPRPNVCRCRTPAPTSFLTSSPGISTSGSPGSPPVRVMTQWYPFTNVSIPLVVLHALSSVSRSRLGLRRFRSSSVLVVRSPRLKSALPCSAIRRSAPAQFTLPGQDRDPRGITTFGQPATSRYPAWALESRLSLTPALICLSWMCVYSSRSSPPASPARRPVASISTAACRGGRHTSFVVPE